MSAYGHQMERESSTQSLSSRGGSEIGSRYTVEAGIYMTSFAAAIFVAALVSVGVLLITILMALTVMLQSCQSKSAGVVELWKSSDDYNHCKIFASHAELNSLDPDSVPAICKHVAVQYIKEGQYMRDLNLTALLAENYFNSSRPLADGLDVVLMDVDDFIASDSHYANSSQPRFRQYICSDCAEEAIHLKRMFSLQLYMKLHVRGWPLILFSRKPEELRNTTLEHLISAGCGNWSSLIMRSDEELTMGSSAYLSRRRNILERQGFRIRAVISSQMDALTVPFLGSRVFKIPNPIYFNTEYYTKSTNLQEIF